MTLPPKTLSLRVKVKSNKVLLSPVNWTPHGLLTLSLTILPCAQSRLTTLSTALPTDPPTSNTPALLQTSQPDS